METTWMFDRMQLYKLMQQHPDWSISRLAQALNRSISWVKKWRRRFREAVDLTLTTFLSRSRAPTSSTRWVAETVRGAVLALRETLGELYHQRVGPKRILYHLHHDTPLQQQGYRLPTSPTTIWRILREAGRIIQPTRWTPIPLPRPEPMTEWEFDFGQIAIGEDKLEFWTVVDRGTSALVDLQGAAGYDAETALLALAQTLILWGCPKVMHLDNDSRFAPWSSDGFPSALERFLLCLDIQVHKCDPASPWQKPFVERAIGSIKHEYLDKHHPETVQAGVELLSQYPPFYNHERPNQSLACGNHPPYVAFPQLPLLPHVPEQVDPDRWLQHCHGMVFRRVVGNRGSVKVDKDSYYVGRKYARERVVLYVDAKEQAFRVLHHNAGIKLLPIKDLKQGLLPFQQFIRVMAEEARSMERAQQMKQRRQRR